MVGLVGFLAQEGSEAAAGRTSAPNWFVEHAFLIPLLAFASGALTLFFGKRTPGKGPVYGILAIGVGLALSLGVVWSFVQGGGNFEHNIEWFTIGTLQVQLGFYVDGLTAVMLVVVTSISLMVHIYSLGYMHGDKRYTWFYVVLSIFTGAMLVVVVASNLFQLLVGWEIMGVCSYLLIGHWYEDHANSSAAIKAFLTTRVGDVPFMFGIFALVYATGHDHLEHPGDQRDRRRRAHLDAAGHVRGAADVRRHDRQVGPVPAVHVAARRDGRPDAGVGADPRRDDGRGRHLPRGAHLRGLRPGRPDRAHDRVDHRRRSRC